MRMVSPPSAQKTMWWTSHHLADRPQPGAVQWRSLAMTARRSPAGMTLVLRPTSRISDPGPKTMRLTEASQASWRTVSTLST